MGLIVHFKVEIATKVFQRITRFDCRDNFIIDNSLGSYWREREEHFLIPNVTHLSILMIMSDYVHHLVKHFKRSWFSRSLVVTTAASSAIPGFNANILGDSTAISSCCRSISTSQGSIFELSNCGGWQDSVLSMTRNHHWCIFSPFIPSHSFPQINLTILQPLTGSESNCTAVFSGSFGSLVLLSFFLHLQVCRPNDWKSFPQYTQAINIAKIDSKRDPNMLKHKPCIQ